MRRTRACARLWVIVRRNGRHGDEIPEVAGHRPRSVRGVPRHDDLRRAEHRSRSARAARLRDRAGRQRDRHRRNVSGAGERDDARAHGDVRRQLARARAPRWSRDHDESRGTRPPRLDPRRAHRSDPRRHRRGCRDESRPAADRSHRRLSDPLAAAQRPDVRRDRVRSGKGKGGPVDRRAGRRDGGADRCGQDPLLRALERDGVGCVRIPARRARAGRCRVP